jgi:hypothetical protein
MVSLSAWAAGLMGVLDGVHRSGPVKREVVRELHKILRTDPFFHHPPAPAVSRWKLGAGFLKLLGALHNPVLLIGLIALIGLLILLICMLRPYLQRSAGDIAREKAGRKEKRQPLQRYLELYRQALEESKAKRYGEAIIALHRSTVEYLLTKTLVTTPNKKYSNNDLKRLLRNSSLFQPFCVIAKHAEIAGFSTVELGADDFNLVFAVFEQSFLSLLQREE